MEDKGITRRDFLKGAAVLTGALALKKLLDGKVYITYVSDVMNQEDKYNGEVDSISYEDLSKFYAVDYVTPYDIGGIGSVTSQQFKPNLITFIEKENGLYQKVTLNTYYEDLYYKQEAGVRYTDDEIQAFYNNKDEIKRFCSMSELIEQSGLVLPEYSYEDVKEIISGYQTFSISQEESKSR